jgi:hypothetical protein
MVNACSLAGGNFSGDSIFTSGRYGVAGPVAAVDQEKPLPATIADATKK